MWEHLYLLNSRGQPCRLKGIEKKCNNFTKEMTAERIIWVYFNKPAQLRMVFLTDVSESWNHVHINYFVEEQN